MIAVASTLSVVVVGVLQGVLIAIGISVLDLLRRVARPHDAVQGYVPGLAGMHDVDDYPGATEVPGLMVYRYDSPLFFANAAVFRGAVRELIAEATDPAFLVLQCEAITDIDVTAADMLERLETELHEAGIELVFVSLRNRLVELLRRYDMHATLDRCRFHRSIELAIEDIAP